jgi:hypothetical protein
MEARVFEKHDVARGHFADLLCRLLADAIGSEIDAVIEFFLDRLGDGAQRHLFDDLALRPAEMGEQDDLGSLA